MTTETALELDEFDRNKGYRIFAIDGTEMQLPKSKESQALYHVCGDVETTYNTLKNKLDIEDFSGRTIVTVLQDFYATLFRSNVSAALKAQSNSSIIQDNTSKNLKYSYVTNENVL